MSLENGESGGNDQSGELSQLQKFRDSGKWNDYAEKLSEMHKEGKPLPIDYKSSLKSFYDQFREDGKKRNADDLKTLMSQLGMEEVEIEYQKDSNSKKLLDFFKYQIPTRLSTAGQKIREAGVTSKGKVSNFFSNLTA